MNDDGNIVLLDDHRPKPDEPRTLIAQISIYDNGDGDVWLANALTHKEQFNWLLMKVAEASGVVVEEKATRTGEM